MTITMDKQLSEFKFWGGAVNRAEQMTSEELDQVGEELEQLYTEGINETTINDLFWFDFGFVCEIIGLEYDEVTDSIVRR